MSDDDSGAEKAQRKRVASKGKQPANKKAKTDLKKKAKEMEGSDTFFKNKWLTSPLRDPAVDNEEDFSEALEAYEAIPEMIEALQSDLKTLKAYLVETGLIDDSEADSGGKNSKAAAMNIFRALNPDMNEQTLEDLEESLNDVGNSLFTLMMTSDRELYETNPQVLKRLFKYILAGRALANALHPSEAPVQERAAAQVLIRSIHKNVEKDMAWAKEQL